MESYRIVLCSGAEEEIGPAELGEDEESFTFHTSSGVRSYPKHDVEIIDEEAVEGPALEQPQEDGKAA